MHFKKKIVQKIIFDKKILFAEINFTKRGPLYTCLVLHRASTLIEVFGKDRNR